MTDDVLMTEAERQARLRDLVRRRADRAALRAFEIVYLGDPGEVATGGLSCLLEPKRRGA